MIKVTNLKMRFTDGTKVKIGRIEEKSFCVEAKEILQNVYAERGVKIDFDMRVE